MNQKTMLNRNQIDEDRLDSTKKTKAKRSYTAPKLTRHGDLKELTKSEYGGLDKAIYGSLFSMTSPALPAGPTR